MLNRAAFVTSLLAAGATGAANGRAVISPAELRHDLDQLWNTLLAVGVYPRILLDQIEPAVKTFLAGGAQ